MLLLLATAVAAAPAAASIDLNSVDGVFFWFSDFRPVLFALMVFFLFPLLEQNYVGKKIKYVIDWLWWSENLNRIIRRMDKLYIVVFAISPHLLAPPVPLPHLTSLIIRTSIASASRTPRGVTVSVHRAAHTNRSSALFIFDEIRENWDGGKD